MKETWKEQLRQKLADYEEPDPLLSWEEVEAALDQRQPSRVVPLWGRRIAAAAAILLIAGGAVLYFNHREKAPEDKAPAVAEIMKGNRTEQQHADSPQEPPSTAIAAVVNRMPRSLAQTSIKETETTQESVAEISETATADTTKAEMPAVRPSVTEPQQAYTQHEIYGKTAKSAAKPLTAKLYFSNTIGGGGSLLAAAKPQQMDYSSNSTQPADDPYQGDTPENDGDVTSAMPGSESSTAQESEHTNHRQPLRFGLLLRYQLSKRWALESGLTYTRLSADITRIADGKTVATIDQNLNYIGIPLSASYLIYKSRHLGFYASGGLLVEKMVYGSRTEAGSRQRVSIGPLQLSVNAGLGAEWRFIPAMSLFVEPGLGYYFDNHSTIPTFYQEHPLGFNLNLGLRFSLE